MCNRSDILATLWWLVLLLLDVGVVAGAATPTSDNTTNTTFFDETTMNKKRKAMPPKLARATTVVFHDPAYPGACTHETLSKLIPGEAQIVHAADLAATLQHGCTTLISFHGPYFPKDAWNALLQFLEAGGNLAVFGGMPFTHPVCADGAIEPEQQAYTEELYLGPFFPLEIPSSASLHLQAANTAIFLDQCTLTFSAEQPGTFWSFYPMLTQSSDYPEEMGSAGPLDTLLTPLLFACTEAPEGPQCLATPAVLLDQQHGRFKGGRWLLSLWQPAAEQDWLAITDAIHSLLLLTAEGAAHVDIHPQLACYHPGEAPVCIVASRTSKNLATHIIVETPQGETLANVEIGIKASPVLQETRIQLPVQTMPGLYHVKIYVEGPHGITTQQETGFWLWEEALVKSNTHKKLTAGRDYFYQNGAVFALFGTTYMDSHVQRRFLTLPNPARWENDFIEMRDAGINMIRTGIWTTWRELMPVVGRIDEVALRAMDAFVMTACKYDIQVIFTFFSFFPPLFEGINPWLDPRSIEGQKDFITAFAHRYAHVAHISWDLINEPSFGDPKYIFSERPIPHYDHFEITAFRAWLEERYTLRELQQRWCQTPTDFATWEQVTLPNKADYNTNPREPSTRQMLKVMDYTLFAQEMFKQWATTLYQTIRTAGSKTLIGVGQDEGGARAAAQFYAPAVDYTTTHPWWNNDDLLWDMLMDKTLAKPNLIQETGVMLVQDVDMRPWRTEQECAYLLERKLITGLIARGAGLIQWLWHINSYMKNENENSIGLTRVDGSAKPEKRVMLEFGRLMREMRGRLVEAETTPATWVVIPYSQWFLRPILSIEGTRRAIRVLGYDFGIVPQMIGEHQLTELVQGSHQPHTIILPSIQTFTQESWLALMQFVEKGTTLLVSGVISRNQHNQVKPTYLVEGREESETGIPISRYEYLESAGTAYQLLFDNDKMGYVKKAHNRLETFNRGKGKIIWSGLPLELSHNTRAVRSVYAQALERSCHDVREDSPLLVARLPLSEGTLVLAVSESSCSKRTKLEEGIEIVIEPNRAGAALIQANGQVMYFGGVCNPSA